VTVHVPLLKVPTPMLTAAVEAFIAASVPTRSPSRRSNCIVTELPGTGAAQRVGGGQRRRRTAAVVEQIARAGAEDGDNGAQNIDLRLLSPRMFACRGERALLAYYRGSVLIFTGALAGTIL
jgi:hypothetical protein